MTSDVVFLIGLAVSEDSVEFMRQNVKGKPEFSVARAISEGKNFCTGFLHLPPGAQKPPNDSEHYRFVPVFPCYMNAKYLTNK